MKKLGIIGIRGLPASYGAFDQFVDQFVKYSNYKKANIIFYISSEKKKTSNLENIENVKQVFFYRGKGLFILFNYFFSIFNFYIKGVRTFLFFGYGAGSFPNIYSLFDGNFEGIQHTHNIFLELAFNHGLLVALLISFPTLYLISIFACKLTLSAEYALVTSSTSEKAIPSPLAPMSSLDK